MSNRITVHCDVFGARANSENFWRNTTSDWIFMLNGNAGAIDDALAHGKKVGVRIYDPFGDQNSGQYMNFDNEYHAIRTPEECYAWLEHSEYAKYKNNPFVYFIIGMNEPSRNSLEDMRAVLRWATRWGYLCAEGGYGALIGGFAVPKSIDLRPLPGGGAGESIIDGGEWDELLEMATVHKSKVIILLHVYTAIRAWQELTLSNFLEPSAMTNPPEGKHVQWTRRPDGRYYAQYHVGRDSALYIYAKENGYDVRYAVSECILDNMPDIGYLLSMVWDSYHRSKFASQPLRGILSLRPLYNMWYGRTLTDEEFGREAFKDYSFLDNEYPEEYEFFAHFAGDFGWMWDTYNVFDPEARGLLDSIKTYWREEGSMNYIYKTVEVLPTVLNIRDAPYGERIGYLERGVYEVGIDSANVEANGGFLWIPIEYNGVEGWVALGDTQENEIYLDIQREEPEPEPPDEPHFPTEDDIRLYARVFMEEYLPPEVETLFQEHVENYYQHLSQDGLPRPLALSLVRFLRWIALVLEEKIEEDA